MRWTFAGRARRAELTIRLPRRKDSSPVFTVRMLAVGGAVGAVSALPGPRIYSGTDRALALQLIRLWTGLGIAGAPRNIKDHLLQPLPRRSARGKRRPDDR